MAFSDYKNIAQVQQEFGIKYSEESFIRAVAVEPTAAFRAEFEFNRENTDIFSSEASRTNLVITPILREVYKEFHTHYSFWIQKSITILGARKPIGFSRGRNSAAVLGGMLFQLPIIAFLDN